MSQEARTNIEKLFQRFAMGNEKIDQALFSRLLDEIGYKSFWRTWGLADYAAWQSLLKMSDVNGDGLVDFDEFHGWIVEKVPSTWKNEYGQIDMDRVRQHLIPALRLLAGAGQNLTYENLYRYFLQQNKGTSFAENRAEIMARLAMYAADGNADGAISFEEINDVLFGTGATPGAANTQDPGKKKGWIAPTLVFGGIALSLAGIVSYGKRNAEKSRGQR